MFKKIDNWINRVIKPISTKIRKSIEEFKREEHLEMIKKKKENTFYSLIEKTSVEESIEIYNHTKQEYLKHLKETKYSMISDIKKIEELLKKEN